MRRDAPAIPRACHVSTWRLSVRGSQGHQCHDARPSRRGRSPYEGDVSEDDSTKDDVAQPRSVAGSTEPLRRTGHPFDQGKDQHQEKADVEAGDGQEMAQSRSAKGLLEIGIDQILLSQKHSESDRGGVALSPRRQTASPLPRGLPQPGSHCKLSVKSARHFRKLTRITLPSERLGLHSSRLLIRPRRRALQIRRREVTSAHRPLPGVKLTGVASGGEWIHPDGPLDHTILAGR